VSEKLYESSGDKGECGKLSAIYVMAPVMCLYVEWVLRKACEAGIGRLYFLARDGYSMYEAARIFCEELKLPIECRYLHCSRYAWRSAEYHLLGEESLELLCLGGLDVSFGKVMERAGLSREEGMAFWRSIQAADSRKTLPAQDGGQACGMGGCGYDTPLSYRQVWELKPLLASCRPFMERVEECSRQAYPSVCGYLRQEGMLDKARWALVDSGWTGSLQKSLQHLLNTMGYEGKVEGYYFGMYEYPRNADRETYHSWYFDPLRGLRRKAFFSNSLFECIFSSPSGQTVGYAKEEGGYGPVFEKDQNPNRKKILETTDILKRYARMLAESCGKEILSQEGGGRKVAFLLLKNFMGNPTKEEAEEFGSYVFCDDVIGEKNQRVAEPLTPRQVRQNRFLYRAAACLKRREERIQESAWPEGSAVLAGMSKREFWHCRLCRYVRYLRKLCKSLSGVK